MKKEIYFILLYVTSKILNKLIELHWFRLAQYVIDFRKKFVIVKLREIIIKPS
jgi:hypothetical protein